jgi:hypothetical protein
VLLVKFSRNSSGKIHQKLLAEQARSAANSFPILVRITLRGRRNPWTETANNTLNHMGLAVTNRNGSQIASNPLSRKICDLIL